MKESEVIKEIRQYLRSREEGKPPVVLWWDRLQSGQIHSGNQHIFMCRPGTPDFICLFVGKDKKIQVLFIEAKSSLVKASPRKGVQTEWMIKYTSRHADMRYMIAQSRKDVSDMINSLAYDFVNEIEYP